MRRRNTYGTQAPDAISAALKPRLVEVTGDELAELLAHGSDDLGIPTLYRASDGWLAYAAELRAWRATHTSGVTDADR